MLVLSVGIPVVISPSIFHFFNQIFCVESNKGDFTSYKKKTKEFYDETDKRTLVKAVYNTGPLSTTPCDISGRPTVAAAADAQKNTSDFFKGDKR